MPQRFLRPGIRTSPRWNSISHEAARLYISILTQVDDYGRYDGRVSVLWSESFAVWNEQNPQLAVSPQETAGFCQQLAAAGLVHFYKSEGREYLQVSQWQERVRGKSKWPNPPQEFDSNPQRNPAESCLPSPSPSHRHKPSSAREQEEVATLPRFQKPTLEAVKLQAAKIGLSEAEAEKFFNYYESNGWRVGKNPMRSWTHALTNWKNNSRNYGSTTQPPNGAQIVLLGKELERVQKRIDTLRQTYGDHQTWAESDRAEYNRLIKIKRELREKLGLK